ncbi:MAG TPA: UTP--glucose-1-phosphate uridylyltransferase [Alphaproteobacteria bacterium]|jgi:UTP--glucose-1-phosphate uridylyltransferase|nr:UTP--glucose-1-phosphate uridylyltransferase [Alphaproteobacteria bacterium]MCB9984218.1 UTP--glucose-1-phosphate uridylyltransferase [Micavibrio sp.]HRK97062.1 UTP--glucose-1-phosphate uridylyltransferase [Alphaproteobacteria bacterium]
MSEKIRPVRKAVLPVAGLGTRLLPATKAMPKEMLTIVDRPLIQMAIEEARQAGIEEFIFVMSAGKDVLLRHFECPDALMEMLEKRNKIEHMQKVQESSVPDGAIKTASQDIALGLGHAIWCAKDLVGDEPFAIILPDDTVRHPQSCLAQMMDAYNQSGGNVVATCIVDPQDVSKYGILDLFSRDGNMVGIKGLVEKPKAENAPSDMAIFGRYILQPEIFAYLDRHETGAGGEIQLTDAMVHLIHDQPFYGFVFEGERLDCGHEVGFVKAQIAYALDKDSISQEIADYMMEKLREYHAETMATQSPKSRQEAA